MRERDNHEGAMNLVNPSAVSILRSKVPFQSNSMSFIQDVKSIFVAFDPRKQGLCRRG